MRYKILKSSLDGISGGASSFETIDEVLREISYHKGWDSREQLHEAIRKWAQQADPGSVFTTQVTAIVAVGISSSIRSDDECPECLSEGPDYDNFEINHQSGHIEQIGRCVHCGRTWVDVFVLVERRLLNN